ncbi:helix-turn-helix domain-containing protein [Mycolicibacterium mageritense]|uniref:helix-turn-helix domain-containing protein n=1 Tax=Mycolicibacterium mageritense TaxID=53462 RepID=UPI0011DAE7A3|nr:helix-turn-helix domain-containing protein [Mycolicibacterium mageritense]TXI62497.1 MAG: DNA-binding protein [Mycolicibacterium mageritense]
MTEQRTLTRDSLLTISEAAVELRISERTLFRLMTRGDIRTVRIGSRTLIRHREITRFVDAAERPGDE